MHLYFFKESLKQYIFIINILQNKSLLIVIASFLKCCTLLHVIRMEIIYSLDFSPAFIFYTTQDGIDNASSAYFPHNKSVKYDGHIVTQPTMLKQQIEVPVS